LDDFEDVVRFVVFVVGDCPTDVFTLGEGWPMDDNLRWCLKELLEEVLGVLSDASRAVSCCCEFCAGDAGIRRVNVSPN